MKTSNHRLSRDEAEALAITCLQFIADEPERLSRFMAISGLESQDIREAATEPNFLVGVLDYVLQDESALLTLSANAGCDPASVAAARASLSSDRQDFV